MDGLSSTKHLTKLYAGIRNTSGNFRLLDVCSTDNFLSQREEIEILLSFGLYFFQSREFFIIKHRTSTLVLLSPLVFSKS